MGFLGVVCGGELFDFGDCAGEFGCCAGGFVAGGFVGGEEGREETSSFPCLELSGSGCGCECRRAGIGLLAYGASFLRVVDLLSCSVDGMSCFPRQGVSFAGS